MPIFAIYLADGSLHPEFLPAADLETAKRAAAIVGANVGQELRVQQVNRKARRALRANA